MSKHSLFFVVWCANKMHSTYDATTKKKLSEIFTYVSH